VTRRGWWVLAVAAGLGLGGWAAVRTWQAQPAAAPPVGAIQPGAGPSRPPTNADLVADKYNAVLQVRARDAGGTDQSVGTALPRRLSLNFTDKDGRDYAEQFDRVGMWAIEIPPGTYRIARDQPGLGGWRWKVAGEGLAGGGAAGWTVTFHAGAMNPLVDLLLY